MNNNNNINNNNNNNNHHQLHNEYDLEDGVLNHHNPPIYTGGYRYAHFTHTFTSPGHRTHAAEVHGHEQPAVWGWGLPMEENHPRFTVGGWFSTTWIQPLIFNHNVVSMRRGGWCVGCGFYLVNPRLPHHVGDMETRQRFTRPTIDSGAENYKNYYHYACSKSHQANYPLMRWNAMKCLLYPNELIWGVSSNQQHHKHQDSFTYCEMMDLFVGLKLSGQLDVNNGRINWDLTRRYCYILQLTNKTNEQMRRKYRALIVEDKYQRYFTDEFRNTIIDEPVAL